MTPAPGSPTRFVLWFRRDRRQRWRVVASAPTEPELTERMSRMPSGDYLALPLNIDPNQRPRAKA